MLSRDAFESSSVVLHLRIVCQGRTQFAEDSGGMCVGRLNEAIVGPLTVAPRGDETGAAKVRKMPRNLGLIGLEYFNARAHTEFIVAQQVDEPQSGVVGQCSKE